MAEYIVSAIAAALGLVCLVISLRQFSEKGFVFNNTYLWIGKAERAKMDKKPHYRQSAIVFALLAAAFFTGALRILLDAAVFSWLFGAIIAAVLIYAIASSIKQ